MKRLAISLLAFVVTTSSHGDPGQPVAVRFWGQGLVTIETFWNLRIAIDPYELRTGYDDPEIEADLVLITHEHFDHNNAALIGGNPHVERGLDDELGVRDIDLVLDRRPNEPEPFVKPAREVDPSPHAIRVRAIAADHDATGGTQRGRCAMFLVEADDVRILHCGDLGQTHLTDDQLEAIGRVDVLLIPVGGIFTIEGPVAAKITEQVRPAMVVPIHYKTPALAIGLQGHEAFIEGLPERYRRVVATGNTLAVTAGRGASPESPQVVVLRTRPASLRPRLARLLADKEVAAASAGELFAGLSVEQLNHRPADGSHTPRWNAEHVSGRELQLFSAAFSAIDPALAPLDLNPAQMPPDYTPAHPDWTGVEEARSITRVQAYVRRFAYLLAAGELDVGLFEQMTRHYGEHVVNVKKKFKLPDWPQE